MTRSAGTPPMQGGAEAGRSFVPTRWSVVLKAAQQAGPEADLALAILCETYWFPLYAFVRRQGHAPHDAEDLTQAFFARLLQKRYLEGIEADPLCCRRCGAELTIIAFIERHQTDVIEKIFRHCGLWSAFSGPWPETKAKPTETTQGRYTPIGLCRGKFEFQLRDVRFGIHGTPFYLPAARMEKRKSCPALPLLRSCPKSRRWTNCVATWPTTKLQGDRNRSR